MASEHTVPPAGGSPEGGPEAETETPRTSLPARGRRVWLWRGLTALSLAASLGLVFLGATWLTLSWAVRSPDVTLPDLTRLDVDAGEKEAERLGLRPQIASRRYDEQEPAGKILAQYPVPGSRTKPGRPVHLVVSLGPERAVVPDLRGSSQRRAQLALRAAGLSVADDASVPHPSTSRGRVICQTPVPGTEGFPGDRVSLLVSAGPRERAIVMPSLTGWSVASARRWLRAAGIRRISTGDAAESVAPSQRVTDQRPGPGSRVGPQTPITLVAGERRLGGRRER